MTNINRRAMLRATAIGTSAMFSSAALAAVAAPALPFFPDDEPSEGLEVVEREEAPAVETPAAKAERELPSYVIVHKTRAARKAGGGGLTWWGGVKPTGRYGDDCETGARLAEEWMEYSRTYGGMQSLVWTIGAMPRDFTGLEVGFLSSVSRFAGLGALITRELPDIRLA